MTSGLKEQHSWQESFWALRDPKVITMLFLGFSAGLPIMMIFSSLSIWLLEAGIKKSDVTFFSWAALGYSFKFIWAPLVDRLPLPILTRILGPRRSWMLLAQFGIIAAMIIMAMTDPAQGHKQVLVMAFAAVLLGFSSATQDIVIDAYRIESAKPELQAMMAATYMAGYRLGMIATGAGALFLAHYFGSTKENYLYEAWLKTHLILPLFMLVGVITALVISEPLQSKRSDEHTYDNHSYARLFFCFICAVIGFIGVFFFSADLFEQLKTQVPQFWGSDHLSRFALEVCRFSLAIFAAFLIATLMIKTRAVNRDLVVYSYVTPVKDFLVSYGVKTAFILLALVSLFRISDIVLGVISNIFYTDMGFTKNEIALAVKFFGVWMTILGGFVGGLLTMRFGVICMLAVSAIVVVITNLCFILLAEVGYNIMLLYLVVGADNLAAGIAGACFIAFLSALVNVRFTAMQYAIFSSLMTLLPKLTAGYSGSIVEAIGYTPFFIFTGTLGLPVLLFIYLASKRLELADQPNASSS